MKGRTDGAITGRRVDTGRRMKKAGLYMMHMSGESGLSGVTIGFGRSISILVNPCECRYFAMMHATQLRRQNASKLEVGLARLGVGPGEDGMRPWPLRI